MFCIKGYWGQARRPLKCVSILILLISLCHTECFIFPIRVPPAYDSQRWLHAFAFMDTLQQSWAPPRAEAPQWLGCARPLDEAGEAEVGAAFNVKQGERGSPEAARAGRHWPKRQPTCRCALQNHSWCSTNKFCAPCSVLMVSRCAVSRRSSPSLSVLCSFTRKRHNHSCKEFLIQPGLPGSQQSHDRASILAASQGLIREISF